MTSLLKNSARKALNVTITAALFATAAHAFADPAVTMAPPVDSSLSQTEDAQPPVDAGVASQDSVFNWQEVPASQNVPIRRAVFDRGGYQLYDTAGETIVVPFSNDNLYVMKFGLSEDGTTYFVNDGDAPVLYVPCNGYLENASVPGARWFPFPEDFHPAQPVFLGIAPSWDDYCSMGWYPDMAFYGGYWGSHPYFAGSVFGPTFGLSIFFGGHHYDGWGSYHRYYAYHPAPYHVTIINRNVYRFGGRPWGDHGTFRGTGHYYNVNRGFGGDHRFGGDNHLGGGHEFAGIHNSNNGRNFGGGHVFNGTGHPYYAHRTITGDRDFNGIRATAPNGGGRAFGGTRSPGEDHSFDAGRTFGSGHTFQGGRPDSTGNFGHSPAEGVHAFNGAGHSEGARPAFQGGGGFGAGRQNSDGGDRPNFSGGGGRSVSSHSDNHENDNRGGSRGGGSHSDNRGGGDHGNRR